MAIRRRRYSGILRDELGLIGTKYGCGMPPAAPAPSISTAKQPAPASPP